MRERKTKEQLFEEFKRLWFKEHRLPQDKKETNLYDWYRNNKDAYQPLIDFCREQGIDTRRQTKTAEQCFEDFKRFWFTEHRLPQSGKERNLYIWYDKNKDKYQPLIDFCREQEIDTRNLKEQNFKEFKRFWFTEHRLPQSGKEINLYCWYRNNKDTYQPLIDFCREQGIDTRRQTKTAEELFEDFKRLWFKEHRLPQIRKEHSLYIWYRNNKDKYKPLKDFLVLIEAEKRGIPDASVILETLKTRGGY